MDYLEIVANEDVRHLREKEATYGGSWKKRGGVGAFMMLARKWDRIENMMRGVKYDIFESIKSGGLDGVDGTTIAEVRDLRRYLLLVEAEMQAEAKSKRGVVVEQNVIDGIPGAVIVNNAESSVPGTPEDGGHHARHHDDPRYTTSEDWPWTAEQHEVEILGGLLGVGGILYSTWSKNSYRLTSHMNEHQRYLVELAAAESGDNWERRARLRDILHLYDKIGPWWVLRVREVPAHRRWAFDSFGRELNHREFKEVVLEAKTWAVGLYTLDQTDGKHKLRPGFEAWAKL